MEITVIVVKNVIPFVGEQNFYSFSFDLNVNDIVILHNKSGSGKTTLLKILSGQKQGEFYGAITIDGIKFNSVSYEYFRDIVGYLDQEYTLFPHMTIIKQLLQPLLLAKKPLSEAHDIIKKLAKSVCVEELFDRYPYQLSGGQKQRIALIKVLSLNKQYIFLDEPTSAIDYETKELVAKVILAEASVGKSFCIATHDSELIAFLSKSYDKVVVISE
jgi:polar amino acid transport system ATP-binding protein